MHLTHLLTPLDLFQMQDHWLAGLPIEDKLAAGIPSNEPLDNLTAALQSGEFVPHFHFDGSPHVQAGPYAPRRKHLEQRKPFHGVDRR